MRLFIALTFSEKSKAGLDVCNQALRLGCDRGRFTHADNFHLTLAFLGEEKSLGSLPAIIDAFPEGKQEIILSGWGSFSTDEGRLYYRDCRISPDLINAQRELIGTLREAGYHPDGKAFKPHITLVRGFKPKHGFDPGRMLSALPDQKTEVGRITLLKSERILGRLTYTELYGKDL